MDFRSRDRYRHAVEELALPTGEAQLLLALKSVERARQVHVRTPDDRAAHVGYHLIGAGRRAFERSVAWQPDLGHRVRRLFFAWATPVYLGSDRRRHGAARGRRGRLCRRQGWRGAALAFVALLTVVPASELVIQLLQRVISYLIPPRRLPRIELDARAGVGAHDGDRADAARQRGAGRGADRAPRGAGARQPRSAHPFRAAQRLSRRRHGDAAAGRRDPRGGAQPASPRSTPSTATAAADRFFLFHRLRQWNAREGLWMGWERKRGKIEEFNRLLRGATDTSFAVSVGDLSILPDVKYCITLDSDTRLPRDVARELIGIIIHPAQPRRLRPAAPAASPRATASCSRASA